MEAHMSKKKPGILSRLRTYTALVSTVILYMGAFGVKSHKICSPGFTCHGCPWATCACPVGVTAYSSAVRKIPYFALGSVLLLGALIGRLACGFVCPFGLLQDLLHRIPSKKFKLPVFTRYIKYAALALLVFIFPFLLGFTTKGYVKIENAAFDKKADGTIDASITVVNPGAGPVRSPGVTITYKDKKSGKIVEVISRDMKEMTVEPGQTTTMPVKGIPDRTADCDLSLDSPQSVVEQAPPVDFLYYCKICPNGTLTATLPSYFSKDSGQSDIYKGRILRFVILGFFLLLMVFVSRPFCRTFCPLGALYAIAAPLALTRVMLDKSLCINCGQCDKVCPVDLDVRKEVGGTECIACGDCIKICPKAALTRKIGWKEK